MEIVSFRTPGLGDQSYLLVHRGLGVLVDPQRDIDRFLDAAAARDVEVRFVLETHLHNDYVSGGPQAALRTGAELVLPAAAGAAYRHTAAFHLEDIPGGRGLTLRPVHTPGHTPEHTSYLVLVDGEPQAVFSGGSLLVSSAGQPMTVAVPTALVVVTVSSAGALLSRLGHGQVRWPVTGVFAAGGVPAALAGAALGRGLPDRLLLPAFACVMVIIAVRMLRGGEGTGGACRVAGGRVDRRRCLPRALAAGAGIGLLTGLLGVGGGFAVVPALTLLLGLPVTEAVATSLVVISVNSAAALAAHAGAAADLDWTIMLVFAAAALPASLAAGRLAGRLDADRVRYWFAWAILFLAPVTAVGAFL